MRERGGGRNARNARNFGTPPLRPLSYRTVFSNVVKFTHLGAIRDQVRFPHYHICTRVEGSIVQLLHFRRVNRIECNRYGSLTSQICTNTRTAVNRHSSSRLKLQCAGIAAAGVAAAKRRRARRLASFPRRSYMRSCAALNLIFSFLAANVTRPRGHL